MDVEDVRFYTAQVSGWDSEQLFQEKKRIEKAIGNWSVYSFGGSQVLLGQQMLDIVIAEMKRKSRWSLQ